MKPMRLLPILAVALSISTLPTSTLGQHGAHDEKLGRVAFPVSCSPTVQKPFEPAVALLHSFWYLESLKAFTAITQTDPDCAMGYWGIAMSHCGGDQIWYLLLDLRQPAPARREYEASLRLAPNRFRAFYGAAKAAELSGDRETAKSYYAKLVSVAAAASDRPELKEAKAFLSAK